MRTEARAIVLHATIIVDSNTDAVLRHAHSDALNDSALAIQRYVLSAVLGSI